MLTVGTFHDVTAIDLDYDARGVVRIDDSVVYVPYLLPSEKATITITKCSKKFAEGVIVQRHTQSPHRIFHPDEHLGGCDTIHMDEKLQSDWMIQMVKRTLYKGAHLDVIPEAIVTDGKRTHYRNKSVFHVLFTSPLSFGLYQKNPIKLVQVSEFVLSDEPTLWVLEALIKARLFVENNSIRTMVIRTNPDGKALVTFVVNKAEFKGQSEVLTCLETLDFVTGVTFNLNPYSNTILSQSSITMMGENRLKMPLNRGYVWIDDRSFFQVNLGVAKKVYALIDSYIEKNDIVIDAFSGVGSIGFNFLGKAKEIIMIESNPASYQMALKTQHDLGAKSVKIINQPAEKAMIGLKGNVVILDPPRNGLMPELTEHLLKNPYPCLIYLSCDLKTLARDLNRLKEIYTIEKVYPVLMFPNTSETETLVIMKTGKF